MKLLFLLIALISVSSGGDAKGCTSPSDSAIYASQGSTFASKFRAFGGITVSKAAFEAEVVRTTGLSATCAACFGTSYICGYDNCFVSCIAEGASCDACLVRSQCVAECKKCIGGGGV